MCSMLARDRSLWAVHSEKSKCNAVVKTVCVRMICDIFLQWIARIDPADYLFPLSQFHVYLLKIYIVLWSRIYNSYAWSSKSDRVMYRNPRFTFLNVQVLGKILWSHCQSQSIIYWVNLDLRISTIGKFSLKRETGKSIFSWTQGPFIIIDQVRKLIFVVRRLIHVSDLRKAKSLTQGIFSTSHPTPSKIWSIHKRYSFSSDQMIMDPETELICPVPMQYTGLWNLCGLHIHNFMQHCSFINISNMSLALAMFFTFFLFWYYCDIYVILLFGR